MTGYENWKDNEVGYCARVIRERGTKEVPADCIASYLRVQSASAQREAREDIARALWIASEYIDAGDFASAAEALA